MVAGKRKEIGDVVDVDSVVGRQLIAIGRAVEAVDASAELDRSVGLETSELKPKKRGRPAKKSVEVVDDV